MSLRSVEIASRMWNRDSLPGIAPATSALLRFSIAAVLVFFGGEVGAAADHGQGAQIAATCASCHSLNGRDEGIPPIAGLDEQTIIDAVLAYRMSETPSHVMHAVALSLTDEELASVAAYLAHGRDGP